MKKRNFRISVVSSPRVSSGNVFADRSLSVKSESYLSYRAYRYRIRGLRPTRASCFDGITIRYDVHDAVLTRGRKPT